LIILTFGYLVSLIKLIIDTIKHTPQFVSLIKLIIDTIKHTPQFQNKIRYTFLVIHKIINIFILYISIFIIFEHGYKSQELKRLIF
jgi:hypothetical protein